MNIQQSLTRKLTMEELNLEHTRNRHQCQVEAFFLLIKKSLDEHYFLHFIRCISSGSF